MLIEINWKPDRKQLRTFGLAMLAMSVAVGAVLAWRYRAANAFYACAAIGAVFAVSGVAIPPLARALYVFWMGIGFCVGSVVMPVLVGIIYYGVVTPIGVALRLRGHDPMRRRRLAPGRSYWVEIRRRTEPRAYERQF